MTKIVSNFETNPKLKFSKLLYHMFRISNFVFEIYALFRYNRATMAYKCDNCGKGRMVGQKHKHHAGVAGGRWIKRAPHTQKIFKPNLHSARLIIGGTSKTLRLCTKCLRILKNSGKKKEEVVETPVIQSAI